MPSKAKPENQIVPPRAKPASDAGYFSVLTQAVFQAGFSWQVVRDKWPGFEAAFDNFDVDKVAAYDERDLERLVADAGIIRNGRKIQATIDNARVAQGLIAQHGSFEGYIRSMDELSYRERAKSFIKQFKWLGDMGAYFFFWSVEENVPDHEDYQSGNY